MPETSSFGIRATTEPDQLAAMAARRRSANKHPNGQFALHDAVRRVVFTEQHGMLLARWHGVTEHYITKELQVTEAVGECPHSRLPLVIRGSDGNQYAISHQERGDTDHVGNPLWCREIAAYRLSEILHFHLVPPTGLVDLAGRIGLGRLYRAGMASGPEPSRMPQVQSEELAILDYIIGNRARGTEAYLSDSEGNLVAIDHASSFPSTHADPSDSHVISSDFVAMCFRNSLTPELLTTVLRVDPDTIRTKLADLDLPADAITGAVNRLTEIQAEGMITGAACPYPIRAHLTSVARSM